MTAFVARSALAGRAGGYCRAFGHSMRARVLPARNPLRRLIDRYLIS